MMSGSLRDGACQQPTRMRLFPKSLVLSKSGSEYEVDFVVGRQAKDTAVALSSKLLRVCNELRANINTIENTGTSSDLKMKLILES